MDIENQIFRIYGLRENSGKEKKKGFDYIKSLNFSRIEKRIVAVSCRKWADQIFLAISFALFIASQTLPGLLASPTQ
ncbi:MAG: hypothetical protein AWU59_1506 [Methanolobus sp. T82-4]|nr:MAG: hypothetical protein AWU59_1506 [Methanolobus sp. T82-4]